MVPSPPWSQFASLFSFPIQLPHRHTATLKMILRRPSMMVKHDVGDVLQADLGHHPHLSTMVKHDVGAAAISSAPNIPTGRRGRDQGNPHRAWRPACLALPHRWKWDQISWRSATQQCWVSILLSSTSNPTNGSSFPGRRPRNDDYDNDGSDNGDHNFGTFDDVLYALDPMLFKNIALVGTFKHFVFVYFCILHLIHGNVIFDILESHAFQKYSTCWDF